MFVPRMAHAIEPERKTRVRKALCRGSDLISGALFIRRPKLSLRLRLLLRLWRPESRSVNRRPPNQIMEVAFADHIPLMEFKLRMPTKEGLYFWRSGERRLGKFPRNRVSDCTPSLYRWREKLQPHPHPPPPPSQSQQTDLPKDLVDPDCPIVREITAFLSETTGTVCRILKDLPH